MGRRDLRRVAGTPCSSCLDSNPRTCPRPAAGDFQDTGATRAVGSTRGQPQIGSGGYDVDGQAEPVGAGGDRRPHIRRSAEPQIRPVGYAGSQDLGVTPPAPETSGQRGGPVHQRSGVEHLDDLGVWPAQRGTARLGHIGQDAGQLAAPRLVQRLQQPPVPHGGQGQLVVGHSVGPSSQDDAHCDVLVDDDQPRPAFGSVGVGLGAAAKVGVFGGDAVQLGLELAHEVAGHEAHQNLPVMGSDAGVTRPATPASFLE